MSDLYKAAQQALEALEIPSGGQDLNDMALAVSRATLALRAALAQQVEKQQAEPVAWIDIEEDGTRHGLRCWSEPGSREHPIYINPPRREWQGLSDEEVLRYLNWDEAVELLTIANRVPAEVVEAAKKEALEKYRAIEAALKEKNEGEPQ